MNFLLLPVPPGGLPEPGGHPELPQGEIPGDGVCCIPAAPGSSSAGMGARTPQPSPAPCAVLFLGITSRCEVNGANSCCGSPSVCLSVCLPPVILNLCCCCADCSPLGFVLALSPEPPSYIHFIFSEMILPRGDSAGPAPAWSPRGVSHVFPSVFLVLFFSRLEPHAPGCSRSCVCAS